MSNDNKAWLEGFISECNELGLQKESAAVLLKVASQLSMCDDEHFVASFKATMEKDAGFANLAGRALQSPAWMAGPTSILGYLGLQQLIDSFRQNWRRSPEEASMLGQMQDSSGHPDPSRLVEQLDLLRRSSHRTRSPVGGRYSDPLLGGGVQDFDYGVRY
jgi:hypothetical protein